MNRLYYNQIIKIFSRDRPGTFKNALLCRSSCLSENCGQFIPRQPFNRIHTTGPRCLNPLLLAVARPITKLVAVLFGRGFRKWWQSLPKDKKLLVVSHLRRHKWKYLVSLGVVGGVSYDFLDSHINAAPYTQRKRFDSSQIAKMSDFFFQVDVQEVKEMILPQSHPKVVRVKRVCQRLLHGNKDISQLSKFWTVFVIDTSLENCQVYPSGQIVMYSGMLDLCDNDDQLAVVLSHEMSHVILEHTTELLSYGSLIDMLVLIPLVVIWAFLPNDGIAAVTHWFFNRMVEIFATLPFSRKLEAEADSLGIFLAASSCFDVRECSSFWGRLDILDRVRNISVNQIKYLSTHPSHSDRQSKLDELMASALKTREAVNCPKLSQVDPRTSVQFLQDRMKVPGAVHIGV